MKKARAGKEPVSIDAPVPMPVTEENPVPKSNVIRTPEYVPPSAFSSPEDSEQEERSSSEEAEIS